MRRCIWISASCSVMAGDREDENQQGAQAAKQELHNASNETQKERCRDRHWIMLQRQRLCVQFTIYAGSIAVRPVRAAGGPLL